MRTAMFGSLLAAFAFLAVGGCGAGAPVEPEPQAEAPRTQTLRIYSTAALDGVVASDGSFDASGGSLRIGDLDGTTNGLGSRQFFTFEIGAIPVGMTVVAADLCLSQMAHVGTPYLTHGPLKFELVDYGSSLDGADFDVPTLVDLGGFLAPNSITTGRCVGTTSIPLSYVTLPATRLQVRLKFNSFDSDADGVSDYVVWADAETALPNDPQAATLLLYLRSTAE